MKIKKIISILLLLIAILIFTACTETPIEPTQSEEETTTQATTSEKTGPNILDVIKKERGIDDQEVLNGMLERLSGPKSINILIATPVEITRGTICANRVSSDGEIYMAEYIFKIIDNITGKDIPEYIEMKSYTGGVFEIGEEYLISPAHNYSALWDSYHLSGLYGAISRESLSDSDIDKIRQAVKDRQKESNNEKTVIEKATLDKDFIEKVDLAVVITVKAKEKEEKADHIYDVTDFEIVEVLAGKEHEYLLHFGEALRLNTDVNVGESYIVMLEVFEDSWVLPIARSGAVVSEKSDDFVKYKEAFEKVNN